MIDLGSGDIRYHNYIRDFRNIENKWSRDWHKYPGLPISTTAEDLLIPIGNELQEATNKYWHYSLYLSVVYIIVIFGTKYLMSFREKGFELRRYLAIWNCFLSVFSICGVIRCLPEFLHILYYKGFTASFCDASYYEVSNG